MDQNERVQQFIQDQWGALKAKGATMVAPGVKVTGGKSTGRPAIIVGVSKKLPLNQLRPREIIPKLIEGLETDIVEFQIPSILPKLQAADPDRTQRWRPAFGGISVGHPEITAGTLGGLAWKDHQRYGITNWHVGNMNEGQIGDEMWQPGVYDGGTTDDYLGPIALKPPVAISGELPFDPSDCPWFGAAAGAMNLLGSLMGSRTRLQAVRPKAEGQSLVDMCLIGPLTEQEIDDLIYEIGHVDTREWCELKVGDKVIKSGRTSGLGVDFVKSVGASVTVGLGGTQFADFHDQIITGPISEGGDSGSLVLRKLDKMVGGLLFAGSETDTICNRWKNVRDAGGLD